ncbi:MAG: phosphatidylglycerol lysyltransferase domain-containing protein [Elusimicrobiota bacterium]|jgi:hypothetical protein|nr:phosphatidylglycerol lysyltransferase domain-containing protein [Elusimicrobiota bacterium]
MKFTPLTLEDKTIFEQYISDDINFENNFAVIYSWAAVIDYEIARLDDALILKVNIDGDVFFDTPKTKNKSLDKYIDLCADYCKKENLTFGMKILEKDFENLSPETKSKYKFSLIPNQWDYVYNASELAEFSGRKFQKKRNLLSQFLRKYKYEFIDYDKTKHYEKILQFQRKWSANDNDNWEFEALKRALDNFEVLNLNCDIIEIDGEIAAFSISSAPRADAGEIIFEKGNVDYKGIYAAIVQFSSKKHFSKCKFINREEDMGMENLKKSKQSYNPIMQIKKYSITSKDETNT